MISLFLPAACRNARASMLEGIEGRLAPADRFAVEDHVAGCVRCAEELADLAAAHNAASRALAPYRTIHARVAPGRARLAAHRAARPSPLWPLARVVSWRPEHALVFAVLALAFVGTLPGAQQRVEPRGEAGTSYVRAADDPGGLLRLRLLESDRIPVGDGLVIDTSGADVQRAGVERLRQGLRSSSAQ